MLKGVSCFTDAEAPFTKMSNFSPTPFWHPRVRRVLYPVSVGMDDAKDCRSGNPFYLVFFFFFFSNTYSIAWYYL